MARPPQGCRPRAATEEFRAALVAARHASHSTAEIAQAAGITRQGVWKLTTQR